MKPSHILNKWLLGTVAAFATLSVSAQAATLLYTIEGETGNEDLGTAIVALGDLDADGFGDFAVSDPKFDVGGTVDSGQVLVISGRDGSTLFELRGVVSANQQFGASLVAIHANGDSKLDLAVGAPGGTGAVYIYSGATGALLRTITDPTPEANSLFGVSIANAGDQNSDGTADLFIGASGGATNDGSVFVVSGATGTVINEILPTVSDTQFGASVVAVSDVNADGKLDLAVGSPAFSSNLGQVQLIESDTGLQLDVLAGTLAGAQLGGTLSAVGDRNSDGRIDFVVSSETGGSAFLVSGTTLDTITDLTLVGGAAGFPVVASSGIDIDEDGDTELLIGYSGALPFSQVTILPTPTLPEPGTIVAGAAGTSLGASVAVIPNLGFAIGEPDAAGGGAVHVYVVGEDTDGDGVPNDLDECPNSDLTATVVIDGFNTGVENVVDLDGCSIMDLIEELEPEGGYRNHGDFVKRATKLFKNLREEGLITKQEQKALKKAAAHSDIGKKEKNRGNNDD